MQEQVFAMIFFHTPAAFQCVQNMGRRWETAMQNSPSHSPVARAILQWLGMLQDFSLFEYFKIKYLV